MRMPALRSAFSALPNINIPRSGPLSLPVTAAPLAHVGLSIRSRLLGLVAIAGLALALLSSGLLWVQ